ncbi:hypothetical protein [Phenylobacterium sp.]|uniref:hypothetical protein n=1 Tax=Phenylobacterium sp. TaxID=1871053 RepID=UPI0035B0EE01
MPLQVSAPIHVPLADRPADRLAAIAQALEDASADPRLLSLAVYAGDVIDARLVLFMPDGGREPLTLAEALLLARVIEDGAGWPRAPFAAFRIRLAVGDAQIKAVLRRQALDAVRWGGLA